MSEPVDVDRPSRTGLDSELRREGQRECVGAGDRRHRDGPLAPRPQLAHLDGVQQLLGPQHHRMDTAFDSRLSRTVITDHDDGSSVVRSTTRDAGDPGSSPAWGKQWSRDYPIDVPATLPMLTVTFATKEALDWQQLERTIKWRMQLPSFVCAVLIDLSRLRTRPAGQCALVNATYGSCHLRDFTSISLWQLEDKLL